MSEAWYLSCGPGDVADRAVLVGDPGRVELFATHLDDARMVGDNRGLRAVTGATDGVPVTVCAFGMGAPLAVIVLEELAQLGVRTVLRAGTVMTLVPALMGKLVVASAGVREEAVSATYLPPSFPATADLDLLFRLVVTLEERGERYRIGPVASLDGFYTEMFAARPEREQEVASRLGRLREDGAVAVDMETSAVLAVAARLGVRAGSLCLATVDAQTRAKLDDGEREEGERRLVDVALAALRGPDGGFRRAARAAARSRAEAIDREV
jgi:uridine phosphorylase